MNDLYRAADIILTSLNSAPDTPFRNIGVDVASSQAVKLLIKERLIDLPSGYTTLTIAHITELGKNVQQIGIESYIENKKKEQKEKNDLEYKHLKYSAENAELIYKDYPTTQSRAKWAFYISIAAFVLSIPIAVWDIFFKKG